MIKSNYKSDNSTIVVVGANSGIGIALITELLAIGSLVFGIDIASNSCIENPNYTYFGLDTLDLNAMQGVAASLATDQSLNFISGLVCLSGTMKYYKPIQEQSAEEWTEVYNISFKPCYNACKAFGKLLANSKGSSIVNMSSGLAFGGMANYGPYTNAKASINALTKTLAKEMAPNVRVNSVAPGAVDTSFLFDDNGKTRIDLDAYKKIVPLGNIAKPSEISDVIIYLLSDASSHITGQCIHINGGAYMP